MASAGEVILSVVDASFIAALSLMEEDGLIDVLAPVAASTVAAVRLTDAGVAWAHERGFEDADAELAPRPFLIKLVHRFLVEEHAVKRRRAHELRTQIGGLDRQRIVIERASRRLGRRLAE